MGFNVPVNVAGSYATVAETSAFAESRSSNVLVVSVDGPEWMHELQYMKRDVCTKLNARLGSPVVRDIYLVLRTD